MSESLTLPFLTLSERLGIDSEHRAEVISSWRETLDELGEKGSSFPSTVQQFLTKIDQYAPAIRNSHLIESILGKSLVDFINGDGLHRAITLVMQTKEIFMNGEVAMLDVLPKPEDGINIQISRFSGEQVVCFAANLVLCAFKLNDSDWSYPPLECQELYKNSGGLLALRGLVQLIQHFGDVHPVVIERRRVSSQMLDSLLARLGARQLPKVLWCSCSESMDQAAQNGENICTRVIFADTYVGGGVLGKGRGQEEGLMRDNPATIAALLVCMKVNEDEATVVMGHSELVRETLVLRAQQAPPFVFVDATPYSYIPSLDQFAESEVRKELTKALAGLLSTPGEQVYTAAWGCGTFGGNLQLKFVIQLLACALSGKESMHWETDFSQDFVQRDGVSLVAALNSDCATAGWLWEKLIEFGSQPRRVHKTLLDFLRHHSPVPSSVPLSAIPPVASPTDC